MKAAIYVRVSTNEQAIKGYSLEAQEEKIRAYCTYKNYEIEGVYHDDGFSGSSTSRPALQTLISKVKLKAIDVVIVYKLDRLSRSLKDALTLVDLFVEYGVVLYSLSENIDLSTPFGRAALKMSATWAELERETIVERMKLGKDARNKSGKMMCPGIAPFGYRHIKEEERFEIIPEEATIIKDIFNKYCTGLYSLRDLYDYCKNTYKHPYFNNHMACKPIIHRLMYTGFYAYKGEVIKGANFAQIIDYEIWYKAQEIAERNTSRRTRDNTPYLLTGLIYCADCGNRYVGKTRKHYETINGERKLKYQYRSYGCAARIKNDKKYTSSTQHCYNKIFDAEDLEKLVLDSVANLKFDNFANDYIPQGLIKQAVTAKSELIAKRDKLLDLYMSDAIDKQTFTLRADKIDTELEKLDKIKAEEETKALSYNAVDLNELKEQHSQILTLSKPDQRKLLFLILNKIVVDHGNIKILFNVE